jgi:hypothetical protein
MQIDRVSRVRRLKFRVLAVLAAGAGCASVCSAVDVKHNVLGGTMSFIRGYTDDLWAELIPPPAELLGRATEE